MLGEAAQDPRRRRALCQGLCAARSTASPRTPKGGFRKSPGISVKLTALHPRYEWSHAEEAKAAILPVVRELALKAAKADVHFTIDAEEADRLELSMDMIEALVADDELFANGWGGFGLAHPGLSEARRAAGRLGRRAGPRARPQADGPAGQGRLLGQRDQGRAGRRACPTIRCSPARSRPTSPISPAPSGCSRPSDGIYPAFATHNANTIGAVKALAGDTAVRVPAPARHGRGALRGAGQARSGIGEAPTPVRIYAPVGSHKELLAYLVRRLLENGANSSFVNRIADDEMPVDELVRDPVAELDALEPKRNPAIPLPNATSSAARAATAPASTSAIRWCASRCWSG